MFGLPDSTEVNRRVAKDKFYTNVNLSPKSRHLIKEQVDVFIWRNKLAEGTVSIAEGKRVQEIQIFEIQLRRQDFDSNILSTVAKAIPYNIIFILTFEQEGQAWVEVSDTLYHTDWLPIEKIHLNLDGLNLDDVYENFARQIACGRLDADCDIAKAVERDKLRQKLKREIAALEKKIAREKQFNRQIELNTLLRQLRKEYTILEAKKQ